MEERKNSYKVYDENIGEVTVTFDVIAVISAMAAMEVTGVAGMAGGITQEIISKLGMKKLSKGVHVDIDEEGNAMIDLSIVLDMNQNVIKVSKKVQDKVKSTVENMTGMNVENININISSVATN